MKPPQSAGQPSPIRGKMGTHRTRRAPYGWILVLLLTLFAGCAHVPVASDVKVNDKLQAAPPLVPGEVILVSGENAIPTERNAAFDYYTAGCRGAFHGNFIGELVKTILKINPQPGRFAVRYVKETKKDDPASNRTEARPDSILRSLDLNGEPVSRDHLRYAVHVKESFEATVHAPLCASSFGVASCSNKTVL